MILQDMFWFWTHFENMQEYYIITNIVANIYIFQFWGNKVTWNELTNPNAIVLFCYLESNYFLSSNTVWNEARQAKRSSRPFTLPWKKTTHMREIIFQILGGSGIGSRDLRNVFCMTTRRNTPLFTEFRREFISLWFFYVVYPFTPQISIIPRI